MGRVIAVTSAIGGAGKSLLSACVAVSMAQRGDRVLLIEAGAARCLDLPLGVQERVLFDLGDVLHGRCRPSQALLPAGENLTYLAAPLLASPLPGEDIRRFFSLAAQDYDAVLIDCPTADNPVAGLLAAGTDVVCIVTVPTPAAVRATAQLAAAGFSAKGVRRVVILNRLRDWPAEGESPVDRLIDTVGLPCLGVIPQDNGWQKAAETGALPGRGAARAACDRLAARLRGETPPLPHSKKLFHH